LFSFRDVLKNPLVRLAVVVVVSLLLGLAIASATIKTPEQPNDSLSTSEYCYESETLTVTSFTGAPGDQSPKNWFPLYNCGTADWNGEVKLTKESTELMIDFFSWKAGPLINTKEGIGVFMDIAISMSERPGTWNTTFRLEKDGKVFGDPIVVTIEVAEPTE